MSEEKFKDLAYDVVLPMSLILNRNLEPNAKLLYGCIRNLTKLRGYCFAKNAYLAELMGVGLSAVKEWLSGLEEQGYITIEHESAAFSDSRRILLCDKFNECLRRSEKRPPPAGIPATGSRKSGHPTIKEEYSKEDIEEDVCKRVAAPEKIKKIHCDGNIVEVSLGQVFSYALKNPQKQAWTTAEIQDAWQILYDYKGKIRDPFRFIEGTIEKKRSMEWAEKQSKYSKKGKEQCKTQNDSKKVSKNQSATSSEGAMKEPPCLILASLEREIKEAYLNGLKTPKGSSSS